MKIDELLTTLRPKPKEEEKDAPLVGPITNPERLIGPMRPMAICFPHTSNALRDSITEDLVKGIERRQASVARELGSRIGSILMFDPRTQQMQRRVIKPDGHLGAVEL